MLSGDNGILQKATDAKTKNDEAQIKERIQLAYHSALAKDITGENGELTMSTLQTELNNEFAGKVVTITSSTDNKEWTIEVDDVEFIVPAGKTAVASNLTYEEKTALQTNGITEITGNDITNNNLKNNNKIKAILTGEVPLTTEMTYITGTVNTGVVVSIDGSEFVWVPVPVAITSNAPSTTGVDLSANPGTERPMAILQPDSDANYQGILYDFSGSTSTAKARALVTDNTGYREPVYLRDNSYADASSYNTIGITQNSLQAEYNSMVESVAKYGGFYVGRYELGLEGTNPVSKPASASVTTATANNSNTNRWYGLYSKCKSYSADNLTSTMMWGSQYDAMMNWMAKTGKAVGTEDSSKYNPEQTTGSKSEDVINNVFDLYGCHREWTLEGMGLKHRIPRGSYYDGTYLYSPGYRGNNYPNKDSDNLGCRLSLYIK